MGKAREKSKKIFKLKKLEVGDTFYGFDGYLNHIIGIIEDTEFEPPVKVVAYKTWLKYKARWGFYADALENLLYAQCLLNDISKKDRKNYFIINEADPNGWV